jgi:hypothetical protein
LVRAEGRFVLVTIDDFAPQAEVGMDPAKFAEEYAVVATLDTPTTFPFPGRGGQFAEGSLSAETGACSAYPPKVHF